MAVESEFGRMSTGVVGSVRAVVRGRNDSRVRAVWRISVPFVAFVLAMVAMATALLGVPGLHDRPIAVRAIRAVGFLLTTGLVLALSARLLDRRPIRAYGFALDRRWWRDLAGGLALGVLVPGLTTAGHVALGWATVQEVVSPGAGSFAVGMVVVLLFYVGVGLAEEALFRGVVLLNAVEGLGARLSSPRTAVVVAWVAVSVGFGAFHVRNALVTGGPAIAAYLVTTTILGLAFGLAYVLTGSLALPVGLHVATNFTRSAVFGSTTGGAEAYPALVRLSVEFPGVWETLHGLELLYAALVLGSVVGWAALTRGGLSIDDSVLAAAERGTRPSATGGDGEG